VRRLGLQFYLTGPGADGAVTRNIRPADRDHGLTISPVNERTRARRQGRPSGACAFYAECLLVHGALLADVAIESLGPVYYTRHVSSVKPTGAFRNYSGQISASRPPLTGAEVGLAATPGKPRSNRVTLEG
jgi:hypothetical protein